MCVKISSNKDILIYLKDIFNCWKISSNKLMKLQMNSRYLQMN